MDPDCRSVIKVLRWELGVVAFCPEAYLVGFVLWAALAAVQDSGSIGRGSLGSWQLLAPALETKGKGAMGVKPGEDLGSHQLWGR